MILLAILIAALTVVLVGIIIAALERISGITFRPPRQG